MNSNSTALPNWTDPIGVHNWGGGSLDPMNMYASNQPGGSNYNAKFGAQTPTQIPTLSGGMTGSIPGWSGNIQTYNPSSFGGLANLGSGPYNLMAATAAGPQYMPKINTPLMTPSHGAPQVNMNALMRGFGNSGGNYNLKKP